MNSMTGTRSRVAPGEVFDVLRKSILVDGFHLVVDLDKSHGSYVVDARDGKEYLDFYTYFASLPVGHNHPKMADPDFQKKLLRAALANPANADVYTVEYAEFVDTFQRIAQRDYLQHAFFIAGGAPAVANALKVAFDWKFRKNLAAGEHGEFGLMCIHFKQAFHGRTGYTLTMTNTASPAKTMYFPRFNWPRVENPKIVFPLDGENLARVKEAECRALGQIQDAVDRFGPDIAGLIIEPIQGEGGDNHFRPEFFVELRRMADQNNFLLIYDEVQTGVGLTGKFWAHEHFAGARPDVIAFGKKMQVCGILAGPRVDEVPDNAFKVSSRINSTWGGNLVDMVRAQRYLEIIEEDGLVENARLRGETLLKALHDLEARNAMVTQARGRGLMAAFDLADGKTRDKVLESARNQGLLGLPCGTRSIRFRPSLAVSDAEILKGVDILETAIRAVQ